MEQIEGVSKVVCQQHESIVHSGYSTVLSEGIIERPAHENYHLRFQQKINRIKTRIKENLKQIVLKRN